MGRYSVVNGCVHREIDAESEAELEAMMSGMPYDLSNAVHYRMGAFPPTSLDYQSLLEPLDEASAALARFDAKIAGMVNSELFLGPLRRQDAISSSRMEGTISTIEDLYRLEAEEAAGGANLHSEARDDDIETFLYSRALRNAQMALKDGYRLDEHLIKAAHQELLSLGRGSRKSPGAYKSEQNYIANGRRGKIGYVPISPEQLQPAMAELVKFMNESDMRPLIRIAIAHVEFEALHPFQDGNGRIGRMLITLMLWHLKVLSQPHFFVSGYLEQHKDEYIERMRAVSESEDWTGWVVFFLRAMREQANENSKTADEIQDLYGAMRERFRELLNSQYHDKALDFVFENPVFPNSLFIDGSGIPAASARMLSRRLAKSGLLREIRPASGRRAALYAFDPLLQILEV